ncbi:MAG: stage II sporulation protein M [Bacteroidetes bacterium]|nr:MAG: stage II sporulation protein M [Bacteroidota bacterium]
MRETKFIEQNREKWEEFEAMLRENRRDPEKLNDLFIQITDDLSYARTYYPNRSVRMYLNSLAQRVFHNIYRGKRFPARRFRLFWTDELPLQIWESRQALILSFSIFMLAALIGVVSSMIDVDFSRVILGDGYVEMTLRNIERGDPMAVYKDSQPLGMSVGIAANNLFVALRTAILGVLASIGTIFMLVYNGIMLGAFQYFFVQKGLFWESFLTIWIHGTLEISAIIIAGGAGLVAGSGLLFPGTYTRRQAFQISMRRGLKIFIGLIPMFLLAAFFEGFFTRYTDTPAVVRLLFILCSLSFVLWYFVWLPWYRSGTGSRLRNLEKQLPPTRAQVLSFTVIKSSGEVFSDVFTLLRRHPRAGWLSLLVAAGLFVGAAAVLHTGGWSVDFYFPDYPTGAFQGWWAMLDRGQAPILFWGQVALFYGVFWVALYMVYREMPEDFRSSRVPFRPLGGHLVLNLVLIAGVVWLVDTMEAGLALWLAGITVVPFLCMWMVVNYFEGASWSSLFRAWQLMRWGQSVILGFLIINFAFLVFLFLDSGVWQIVLQFFSWLVPPDASAMDYFVTYTTAVAVSVLVHFVWLLLVAGSMLQYFSNVEIVDAVHLRESIPTIGSKPQIRGLAKE